MKSDAATVDAYLADLEPEKREALSTIRDLIVANLSKGFVESMRWGMPTYEVPLERFPNTYNGQPLAYVSFAAQKRHYSLYLMALYSDSDQDRDFRERWSAPSGKPLNMGKSCVRFTKLEDLDLDLIATTIASASVDEFIGLYDRAQRR